MAGGGRLEGRVALVTGGGTGIGRAVAERFAEEGARVAVAGRRAEPLDEVVASLGAERALAVPGDVIDAGDRTRMLGAVRERWGGLHVLVNAAAAVTSKPVAESGDDDWRRLFEVNVVAALALARDALPALREGRGCILNVSTGASLKPVPGYGVYGATKAGLNYASQVLALEAAPDVRVNVVCPGSVDTPIWDTFLDEKTKKEAHAFLEGATPMGRLGQPADVAAAALYLCSSEAAYVTGALLVVDGGLNLG